MSESKGSVVDFLLGFLIGGAVGAGTALLMAPAKGEETREIIQLKVHDLLKEGKSEVDSLKEIVNQEVLKVISQKDMVKEAIDKGIEHYKSQGK